MTLSPVPLSVSHSCALCGEGWEAETSDMELLVLTISAHMEFSHGWDPDEKAPLYESLRDVLEVQLAVANVLAE